MAESALADGGDNESRRWHDNRHQNAENDQTRRSQPDERLLSDISKLPDQHDFCLHITSFLPLRSSDFAFLYPVLKKAKTPAFIYQQTS